MISFGTLKKYFRIAVPYSEDSSKYSNNFGKRNEKKILLASKSEAHIEQIHEKNRGQKISRYCPFKVNILRCVQNLSSLNNLAFPEKYKIRFGIRMLSWKRTVYLLTSRANAYRREATCRLTQTFSQLTYSRFTVESRQLKLV
jgi:hypothetical protein